MSKSPSADVVEFLDPAATQLIAARAKARAAKQARKNAKAAFRLAKQQWKEARRVAKAARDVVRNLEADLAASSALESGHVHASSSDPLSR